MSNVVSIHWSDTSGNFTASDASAESEHLETDLISDVAMMLGIHHGVVEMVSASVDLDVVDVLSVSGQKVDTAVVHLSGEDLVSEEVVTEETTVRVSEVVTVLLGDIDKIAELGVQCIVLFLRVIKMGSVFVNSVGAHHALEKQERVVVWVLDGWGIVEDTNVGVIHLVVTDHHQGWAIDALIRSNGRLRGLLSNSVKSVVNLVDKLLVVHSTSSNNDDVVTVEVGCAVVVENISIEVLDAIKITSDWLSQLMISVRVIVSIFQKGALVLASVLLVVSNEFLLGEFNFCWVKSSRGHSLAEHAHNSGDVALEAVHLQ